MKKLILWMVALPNVRVQKHQCFLLEPWIMVTQAAMIKVVSAFVKSRLLKMDLVNMLSILLFVCTNTNYQVSAVSLK